MKIKATGTICFWVVALFLAGCKPLRFEGAHTYGKLQMSASLEEKQGFMEGYLILRAEGRASLKEALDTKENIDFLVNETNLMADVAGVKIYPQMVQPISLGKKEEIRYFISITAQELRGDTLRLQLVNAKVFPDTLNFLLNRK